MLRHRLEESNDLHARREAVSAALTQLPTPLVVVIDDVDRLERHEIRAVFKLVRMVADFPNTVYLVAFDRSRVEQALRDDGVDGAEYLDKILQTQFTVPNTPRERVDAFFERRLVELLGTVSPVEVTVNAAKLARVGNESWRAIYGRCVLPLMKTLRDAKRLLMTLPMPLQTLSDRVHPVDLVALEALRLFVPTSFSVLAEHPALFAPRQSVREGREAIGHEPGTKAEQVVTAFLDAAGADRDVAEAICVFLFPQTRRIAIDGEPLGSEWYLASGPPYPPIKRGRVSDLGTLRSYLEFAVPDFVLLAGLAIDYTQRLCDGTADELVESLSTGRLRQVVRALAYDPSVRPPVDDPEAAARVIELVDRVSAAENSPGDDDFLFVPPLVRGLVTRMVDSDDEGGLEAFIFGVYEQLRRDSAKALYVDALTTPVPTAAASERRRPDSKFLPDGVRSLLLESERARRGRS